MEYAISAWAPWNIGDIEVLEKVQERAVKMMTDVRGDTYEERLKDAGLEKLIERRKRGDMIETFKVIKGINKVEKEWFTIIRDGQRGTKQNTKMVDGVATRRFGILEIKRLKLEIKKTFFTCGSSTTLMRFQKRSKMPQT